MVSPIWVETNNNSNNGSRKTPTTKQTAAACPTRPAIANVTIKKDGIKEGKAIHTHSSTAHKAVSHDDWAAFTTLKYGRNQT